MAGILDEEELTGWGAFKANMTDPARMQALAASPMFNVGMGLLASSQDTRKLNPFIAAQQGLQQSARMGAFLTEEQKKKEERENLKALREQMGGLMETYGPQLTPDQMQIAQMYQAMAEQGDPTKALAGFTDFLGDAGIAGMGGNTKFWQDWLAYDALPEHKQKQVLEFRRGQQIAEIGGRQVRLFGDLTYDDILSTLDEEMKAKVALSGSTKLGAVYAAKYSGLKDSNTARKENYASANRILNKIKDQELKTGLYTGMLYQILPTADQEELDSLAEFAARQRLKASGETRPTDADVQGMKRALFGSNLTEEFNKRSLERLMRELESQQHEFDFLGDYFGMVPQKGETPGQLPAPVPGTQQDQATPGLLDSTTEIPEALQDATPEAILKMVEDMEDEVFR